MDQCQSPAIMCDFRTSVAHYRGFRLLLRANLGSCLRLYAFAGAAGGLEILCLSHFTEQALRRHLRRSKSVAHSGGASVLLRGSSGLKRVSKFASQCHEVSTVTL